MTFVILSSEITTPLFWPSAVWLMTGKQAGKLAATLWQLQNGPLWTPKSSVFWPLRGVRQAPTLFLLCTMISWSTFISGIFCIEAPIKRYNEKCAPRAVFIFWGLKRIRSEKELIFGEGGAPPIMGVKMGIPHPPLQKIAKFLAPFYSSSLHSASPLNPLNPGHASRWWGDDFALLSHKMPLLGCSEVVQW